MMKQVQEFLHIVRGALVIAYRSINFIISSLVTSLPLFFFLIFYEMILQRTVLEASDLLVLPPGYSEWDDYDQPRRTTKDFVLKLVLLGLLYLPLHFLEFFNMNMTVNLASKLHEGEKPMSLKGMAYEIFLKARLKDPLITYVYVLFLSTCGLLGLMWLVINYYILSGRFWDDEYLLEKQILLPGVLLTVIFGAAFIAVLIKYLDWCVVWNTSIVYSILEESYGAEALMISFYFSRGSKQCGRLLMLLFFIWGVGIRLTCLYTGCSRRGTGITVEVLLLCIGNVLKWVACTVYFQTCKKRTLEKIDEQVGLEDKNVNV